MEDDRVDVRHQQRFRMAYDAFGGIPQATSDALVAIEVSDLLLH